MLNGDDSMKKEIIILTLFMVIALGITGCTTGSSTSTNSGTSMQDNSNGQAGTGDNDNVKVIRVEAYNFGFDVTGPQINKGDKIKVIVTSREGTHGFALPAFNVDLHPISPGEEKSAEFTADQSGSFDYFCNVPCGPGHRNMRGVLTVN